MSKRIEEFYKLPYQTRNLASQIHKVFYIGKIKFSYFKLNNKWKLTLEISSNNWG